MYRGNEKGKVLHRPQRNYFIFLYFLPFSFFFFSIEMWTFLVQYLYSPSLSSRTFSVNRDWESISSLSCSSLVLEHCVFCLRGTTYTRNLDKLLVSVGLFGFKCTLWLLFQDTYDHLGSWNISTSKVQQSVLQNLKFKLFVLDFLCLQCYADHLTFAIVFCFVMIFVPKQIFICLINISFCFRICYSIKALFTSSTKHNFMYVCWIEIYFSWRVCISYVRNSNIEF